MIKKLELLKWWDLTDEEIKDNLDVFKENLTEAHIDLLLEKYRR